jgi:hypothetical protein
MAIASAELASTTDPPIDPAIESSVEDPTQWGLAGLDIQQLAAAGYFRAIAYWLNEPLVPQNVYAQVLADEVPGRLKVLVEFERAPQPQRLIRYVCDRLYRLNSEVIEGVHLIARFLGSAKTDWEQSIRIPTASQRRSQSVAQSVEQPVAQPSEPVEQPAEPAVQSAEPAVHYDTVHYESTRSQIARQAIHTQFKFFRAALISGAAVAAFLFGGFSELILSGRLSTPVEREPAAAWHADAETDFSPIDSPTATAVSFRPASQFTSRTVEAALETVAVIPHDEVAQPADPTVTLLFGGELSLDGFIFEAGDSLDRLFSDLSIYQQADVSMVGLVEPLAYASTSLQEDFYRRTRPQAVQMLKAGGIDIVSLASEGVMTYGAQGLSETLKTLDRQGIYRVGAGLNQQEAHRPEILEVKGQRIAYLGYNPEAIAGAKAEKAGVAITSGEEQQNIVKDIQAIRSQVDWIVVNYRWGDALGDATEDSAADGTEAEDQASSRAKVTVPADWQQDLARKAVDAGADLVVGYHPSQIQGAEIYRDRAIAYSLGDFIFDDAPLVDQNSATSGSATPDSATSESTALDSAALRVSLRNRQMKVEFLPVTVQDSKFEMATGDKGAAILQTIRNASKTFDQPMRFPVVLDARPLPQQLITEPSEPVAPVEPSGLTAPPVDAAPVDPQTQSAPSAAPSPVSEAANEEMGEEIYPAQSDSLEYESLQNALSEEKLEQWGEKPDVSGPEFSPIPAGDIQRQKLGNEPEEVLQQPLEDRFEQTPLENNLENNELPDESPNELSNELSNELPVDAPDLTVRSPEPVSDSLSFSPVADSAEGALAPVSQ